MALDRVHDRTAHRSAALAAAAHVPSSGAASRPMAVRRLGRLGDLRIVTALDAVAGAPTILDAIHASAGLSSATADLVRDLGQPRHRRRAVVAELRTRTRDPRDRPTAIASVHALARIPGDGVDDILAEILDESPRDLVAHVAWGGAARTFAPSLLDRFVALVVAGGLPGMHAQAALEAWSRTDPWLVAAAIREGIARTTAPAGRRHLVETLGLVPDPTVLDDLARHATDPGEGDAARIAAIAALGARPWEPMARQVSSLSSGTGPIADAAALARMDRVAARRVSRDRPTQRRPRPSATAGLRIAQLHLGAELDPEMRRAGVGATGGIATLLVDLDRALNRRSGIDSVLTIGRGTTDDALRPAGPSDDQRFRPVPLRPEEDAAFVGDWPARVAAERGIRRILGGDGQPDVLHLRMADVGSLAGSRVAAESGIRMVFSLAPDPHGLIAAREAAGELDRATFGGEDARSHLWFRARLVERLARDADQVVLFPREHLEEQLRDLVGIDIATAPRRFTVIPEGIDVQRIDAAEAALAMVAEASDDAPSPVPGDVGSSSPAVNAGLGALLAGISDLPVSRHGLPVILSIGRLHEVKGMTRLVAAFGADPSLRARANLVIVGGDLDAPSPDEAAEIDRIHAVMRLEPAVRDAVVLLGHRPNGDVGYLLAAAHRGVGSLIAPLGAYACASAKEEFGLAIVEALATGLSVVAPRAGGPATYVEDGRTGVLVDTVSRASLIRGIHAALDLADVPGRADHARGTVRRAYDVRVMAELLETVYASASTLSERRAS